MISFGFKYSVNSSIHLSILSAGRLNIIILGLGVLLHNSFRELSKCNFVIFSDAIFSIILSFFSKACTVKSLDIRFLAKL